MSVPTEEIVQHLDFIPEPAVDRLILDADADHLDFIPDDPAELRRAVTRMAGHINLADWRFIKLIAAMERSRGWREGGYCNLGNWLDHRCGLGPCASRERIRIGRALAKLPQIDAAFRDGMISYSKVRAITRVATPETDAMLLAIAEGSSAAQLESLVRTYERVGADDREWASSEQRRSLSWYYEDGMLVITAAVPAERGALVIKALQQVVDGRKDEREAYYQSVLPATCRGRRPVGGGDSRPRRKSRAGLTGRRCMPLEDNLRPESVVAGDDFGAACRDSAIGGRRRWRDMRARRADAVRMGGARCFRGNSGRSRGRGQRRGGLHAGLQMPLSPTWMFPEVFPRKRTISRTG